MIEQRTGGERRAIVARGAPCVDFAANTRDKRREKFFAGGGAKLLIGGKPAVFRNERGVGGDGKVGMEGHANKRESTKQ